MIIQEERLRPRLKRERRLAIAHRPLESTATSLLAFWFPAHVLSKFCLFFAFCHADSRTHIIPVARDIPLGLMFFPKIIKSFKMKVRSFARRPFIRLSPSLNGLNNYPIIFRMLTRPPLGLKGIPSRAGARNRFLEGIKEIIAPPTPKEEEVVGRLETWLSPERKGPWLTMTTAARKGMWVGKLRGGWGGGRGAAKKVLTVTDN